MAGNRRDQRRDELKRKILDAARELFVMEGVEKVSMRKVAQKIGYTATTLYDHFHDKEAMLLAICEAYFLSLRKGSQRIAKIADPLERLRELGFVYVEYALRHPSHYRLMFMTPRVHQMNAPNEKLKKGDSDQDAYAFLKETVSAVIAEGLSATNTRIPTLLHS
jgi:AcrR family transcriptional regulator